MEITATVTNTASAHTVTVRTGAVRQSLAVPHKTSGSGSAVNGGEFLMLALATCYCNDLYREAARLGVPIEGVEVEAMADFPGVGLAARDVRYRATVTSSATPEAIARLLRETDAVAEIHNTVRAGVPVELQSSGHSLTGHRP
jgi:organic hydroperoxide reductase OsmC/OhrA